MAYDAIPYASEQGIYFGLTGKSNRAIRQFILLIRESHADPRPGIRFQYLSTCWGSRSSSGSRHERPRQADIAVRPDEKNPLLAYTAENCRSGLPIKGESGKLGNIGLRVGHNMVAET